MQAAGNAGGPPTAGQSVPRARDNPGWLVENPAVRKQHGSRYMNTQNPYAPPRTNVSDVAVETEELELAGRGVRFGANFIDGLILGAVIALPLISILAGSRGANGTPRVSGGLMLLSLVGFAVWAWFTIMYVSRNGQSIAKKMLGIKVVRTDGTPATLGRIFWMRNVVNGLLGIIPFYSWVDPLLIFSDSRQCVHDKIADTIVVVA